MSTIIKTILLITLTTVIALSMTEKALAQASECGVERKVNADALTEATWKRLNDVFEDVGEELYDVAYEKLMKMNARARSEYEQAVLAQALAQVQWSRADFDSALVYFEKAVGLDVLPNLTHFSLMYQIAQLYYMKERYDEALEKMELWMCKVSKDKITAESWYLIAVIHTAREDWQKVVPAIEKSIAMADQPKESWYQLKLAAHFELEQFPDVAQTLETMIGYWPDKKNYWIQLSQIYYKLKKEEEALSVLALAYRRNMLEKQTDIMYLSNLYSNAQVPFKAAAVLQKGIEDGLVEPTKRHWTIIADAWYGAEEMERALAAYEQAGKASDDGEIDLRRAYILVDMERWSEASVAVNAALEKGGFSEKKIGDAYVILGMSEFNLGNYNKASTAWGHASKYPKAKKSAQQWMNHMREEQARRS